MNNLWVEKWKSRGAACLQPRQALMITVLILMLGFPLEDIMRERSAAVHGMPKDDFTVYYEAARKARQPGEHYLYTDAMRDRQSNMWGEKSFYYPPFAAEFMELFTLTGLVEAFLIWKYVIVLITALAIYFTLAVSSRQPVSLAALAIGVAGAFSFSPFQFTVLLGQMSGIILLTWALGIYLFWRGRPVTSAFCFALGTVVKLAPLIVVPLFVMRRQWRWLGGYIASIVALTGVSVWQLGWQPYRDWIRYAYPVVSSGFKYFQNRSLPGLILWCTPGQTWMQRGSGGWELKLPTLILTLCFLVWCWIKSPDRQGLPHELSLAPLLYLLVSPIAETHHFIIAIIPLVYLWMKSQETGVDASKIEIGVLIAASLIYGIAAPGYLAGGLNNPTLFASIIGMWVLVTIALIWVGMRMHSRCIASGDHIRKEKPSLAQIASPSICGSRSRQR